MARGDRVLILLDEVVDFKSDSEAIPVIAQTLLLDAEQCIQFVELSLVVFGSKPRSRNSSLLGPLRDSCVIIPVQQRRRKTAASKLDGRYVALASTHL